MPQKVTKPKLLLVEGKDEVSFFNALNNHIGTQEAIDIQSINGKTKLHNRLIAWMQAPGHETLEAICIVMDADKNPEGTFTSICGALEKLGLPIPPKPMCPVGDSPRISVMILPRQEEEGMLEDLCLESINDDPAMVCVNSYFSCLKERLENDDLPRNPAKARVKAFLASKGWIEEGYFESIQDYIEFHPPNNPAVEKVQVFLASRSKPNLNLGLAAKSEYWPFDHPVFSDIEQFLLDF